MSSLRSHDDTWDIATSVGSTAVMVAAARAKETESADPLIRDPYARILVGGAGPGMWESFLEDGVQDRIAEADPDAAALFANMLSYQAVRTHFFDRFFAESVEAGIRQVVILASGLDSRAYRLPWPVGTVVYEIDQPKVLDYKSATLAAQGVPSTAERREVAIDLRQDWPAALAEAGFDPTAPTAWIAEGLVMYLPADAQDRLLDAITELSAPGSRLAVEAVSPPEVPLDPDQQRERALKSTERWRNHGFDLDFSELVYTDERTEVPAYLGGLGWQITVLDGNDMLTRYGLDPVERDENAGRPIYITATR